MFYPVGFWVCVREKVGSLRMKLKNAETFSKKSFQLNVGDDA